MKERESYRFYLIGFGLMAVYALVLILVLFAVL